MIARVAVFLPVEGAFDYSVPPPLAAEVRPGVRVWAPYGGRSVEGVVIALDPPDSPPSLKPLHRLVGAPPIAPDLVQLAAWIADYYLAPPGEVMRLFLPAGGRAQSKRTLALTEAGAQAASSLQAALESPSVAELGGKERALLTLLQAGRKPFAAVERELAGAAATVKLLVERGLVTVDEKVKTRGAQKEIWLEPGRPPTEADQLVRAPRRRAVLETVVNAGRLSLEALRELDPRAPAHVRGLVEDGLLRVDEREVARDPFAARPVEDAPPPSLNAAQERALRPIEAALESREYQPFLLHGVTGSGKTEVYLRAIARALELDRRALVLVPEISLTPQLAARFRGRFGNRVAVLHSGLTDAERADAFRRVQRGEVDIVVGARSAVFAPFDPASKPLGIVVVDEEHDPSFKQQEGVRYHGRDVALVRARAAQAVAVLGSATPSLETFAAAKEGRLTLLELPERATPRPLPEVQIVDLKVHKPGDGGFFSAPLVRALEETLTFGEQAILFLNRRGYSTFILCKSCGQAVRCRHCSVTLTYHRAANELVCHYCGYQTPSPTSCPSCSARSLDRLGFGTEQVEEALRERFPRARVARLDRDTAAGSGLLKVLDGVRDGSIDVVVGTQMVTKGHDFPNVTLVGVVLADHGMGLPDFRAAERTFQLLEQVAGRAGRGQKAGRVVVQTYSPDHPAVVATRTHDYHRFVESELEARRELGYPPSLRLACVHFDGADAAEVRRAAESAAESVRATALRAPEDLLADVVGPAEAPLARLKGRTRWQLFCKAKHVRGLRTLVRAAVTIALPRSVRVSIDVDPISML